VGSNSDLEHVLLDGLVNGNIDSNVGIETIAGWTGIHALSRPSSAATTTSLTNASAVSNGSTYDCGYVAFTTGVQITSSAALTAGSIQIQASLDNVSWANVGAAITAATDFPSALTKIYCFGPDTNGAARFWRVAITTLITGGTVTAKIRSS
jgi:hypothetical protein